MESEVTLLCASDNENVKEDDPVPEVNLFRTVKDSQIKLGGQRNHKLFKRKANEFPGHYPMTRKAKLKTCESAPNPTPLLSRSKISPLSPVALKSSQTLAKFL